MSLPDSRALICVIPLARAHHRNGSSAYARELTRVEAHAGVEHAEGVGGVRRFRTGWIGA